LRERSAVEGHIAQHALFVWTHQPDVLGLIEAARKRVRDLVAEDERSAAVLSKQREEEQARARRRASEEASRHWAEIANRLSKEPRHHDASESELARVPEPPTSAAGTSDLELAWAPEHKPSTSFIFYRLNAAEAWIVYTMKDGSSAIAPWPEADEGWDEALPAAVGVPDARLKVYRVKDLLLAMTFFSSRAGTIRATSNPRDFEKL
jgi:hypothetical protein